MPHWTDQFSFSQGTIRFSDLCYFSLTPDGVDLEQNPHCAFTIFDQREWTGNPASHPRVYISGTVCSKPMAQFVGITADGTALHYGSDDEHTENIHRNQPARGPLRRIRSIGGKAHVVGMMRQVYRREDANKWVAIDTPAMRKATEVVGFETIDGFAEDDLYCAGWEGEIWHYNGTKWRQIHSPTNIILMDMCCVPDGKVYICGQMGKILRGRDDTWEVIEHDGPKVNWWNCCWYQDKLWLATDRGLFTLEKNDKLVAVDFGDEDPSTFRHLSTADGVLLSTGAKDVLLFDGTRWTRID